LFNQSMKKSLLLAVTFLTAGLSAFATSIAPSGTALVSLPAATFGGTGIANDKVEVTTVTTPRQDVITMGLTATPRYSNPALGNNGFGTFTATPGFNNGLDGASPAHAFGPTWNFDVYLNVAGNSGLAYSFALAYANNTTGVGNTITLGTISTGGTFQDSWNLSMGFLTGIGFNPNDAGIYGLALEELNSDGHVIASTAINVNVAGVPDSGSTALLLGLSFAGLAAFGYRRSLALAK
jgi:hypothetical protein